MSSTGMVLHSWHTYQDLWVHETWMVGSFPTVLLTPQFYTVLAFIRFLHKYATLLATLMNLDDGGRDQISLICFIQHSWDTKKQDEANLQYLPQLWPPGSWSFSYL